MKTTFSELKSQIAEMYGRTAEHWWSYAEESALSEVERRPKVLEELQRLKAFKPTAKYFPKSVEGLLENWCKTLDRAGQPVEDSTFRDLKSKLDVLNDMAQSLKMRHCAELPMGMQWDDETARQKFVWLKQQIQQTQNAIAHYPL